MRAPAAVKTVCRGMGTPRPDSHTASDVAMVVGSGRSSVK